ncbi:MAG TPA: ATP-binding protein [Candidatus Binataceae bacterium]|nr:ATP-binding protein [Candidatus Binataceae bacterium]
MGLRVKLGGAFAVLLIGAVLAVSIVDISWTLAKMTDEVIDSGNVVAAEVFEQVRAVLAHTSSDPINGLRADPSLAACIQSVRAFATGIVFIGIAGSHGENIVSERPGSAASTEMPSIDVLRAAEQFPLPFELVRALWRGHDYVLQRQVLLNQRPFAVIRVGVSTALITDEVHKLVWMMVGVGIAAILIAGSAGAAIGALLSRSVVAISSGVEQLARGGEEVELRVGRRDELGSLAAKFNRLSRQVLGERNRWENERGGLFKALRTMTDGIFLMDADGTVLFANSEAHARLGLGANGSDGGRLPVMLGRSHPLVRMVEAALATGTEAHDVAIEMKDAHQQPVHYLVSIFPLSRGREAAGLLVTLRDLKPMAEIETVVEYSSHLARLGGLISGVAHQIRKPLNVLAIRLEWMRQDAEQGGPVTPHIESIRYEIHRLDRVVDGLLRFMRPEHLELSELSVADLLTEAGGQVTSSTIKVDYQIDDNLPTLEGDRALLTEAFRNIFQNAAESTPDGGLITVKASYLSDGFIEVRIADHGHGIESEQRGRIFDLYFTTKPGGTGLGLSLALRAIDLHHGTIDIDSETGFGTKVRVRLPAERFTASLELNPPA